MKKLLFPLGAILLLLSACQKEAAFENPDNLPGTASQPLLVRTVEVSGSDSNVTVYAYDPAGRLLQVVANNTTGISLTYTVRRNAAGIITKTVAESPQFAAFGFDSLVTDVYYNAAASRYAFTRYDVDLGGILYSDSTVFAYDGNSNVTGTTSYGKVPLGGYAPSSKTDYTYTSGNVATQKYYDYDAATTTWALSETTTFGYDAKLNPLKLGVEGILLGMPTSVGSNNAVLQDYNDATDPTNNFTHSSTLTYNGNNRPSGGTMVETPGPVNYTLRFYYN